MHRPTPLYPLGAGQVGPFNWHIIASFWVRLCATHYRQNNAYLQVELPKTTDLRTNLKIPLDTLFIFLLLFKSFIN